MLRMILAPTSRVWTIIKIQVLDQVITVPSDQCFETGATAAHQQGAVTESATAHGFRETLQSNDILIRRGVWPGGYSKHDLSPASVEHRGASLSASIGFVVSWRTF